jgi:hypothetical protein
MLWALSVSSLSSVSFALTGDTEAAYSLRVKVYSPRIRFEVTYELPRANCTRLRSSLANATEKSSSLRVDDCEVEKADAKTYSKRDSKDGAPKEDIDSLSSATFLVELFLYTNLSF